MLIAHKRAFASRQKLPLIVIFSTHSIISDEFFVRSLLSRLVAPALLLSVGFLSIWMLSDWAFSTSRHSEIETAPHYKRMKLVHERLLDQVDAGANVQLAFVGDSLIAGWLTAASFPSSINLGIGKDTLQGLLGRLQSDTVNRIPIWYLGVGVNDIFRGVPSDDLNTRLNQISQRFQGAELLIWRSVLPTNRKDWTAHHETQRQMLNAKARDLCAAMENCVFLSAPRDWSDRLASWTHDGLHPNGAGYAALGAQLNALLRPAKPNG
jgi:lysophospholipase L1-like esterase